MDSTFFFVIEIVKVFLPVVLLVGTMLLGFALRAVLFNRLADLARRTKNPVDDVIIGGLRGPFMIWSLMLGVYLVLQFSHLPANFVQGGERLLLVLGILSVTVVLANISSRLVHIYSRNIEVALPVTSLTQNISRLIIFGVGFLMILNSLGIPITPILASLGVGGLAVALALQDTLSNLFSGFYISVSKQLRVGDYVKLQSGEEGYVCDINWRTTQLRSLYNTTILIPNAKLTQTIFTNYNTPGNGIEIWVPMAFDYGSDMAKLEAMGREVGIEVMKNVPGGVAEFEPSLRFDSFPDFRINVTAILKAKDFRFQYGLVSEFIKRLQARLKNEKFVMEYPAARWPNWPPIQKF